MLPPLIKLNAKVEIGPSIDPEYNITPYVISINRSVTMCSIEGEITIELSPDIVDYINSIGYTIHTYHKIRVKEFGINTFYGYISSIRFARIPHKVCIIKAFDIYKLAKDTLIIDETEVTNGETIGYWLNHLSDLAGISFYSDQHDISDILSPAPGISFNYRTVDAAMQDVTSFSNGYLYTDANATLHFKKGLITDETYIVSGGDFKYCNPNYPSGIWQFSGGNTTNASWDMSDKMSRNVAKVWGFKGNVTLLPGESPYITSTVYGDYPLPVNRTVLYSSTMIQTQAEADRIANEIITDLSRSTSIKTFEITGNPKIRLCRDCFYWVDLRLPGIHGHGPVTTIQTVMDKNGYKTILKVDEFCPRFGGWSIAPPIPNTLWIAGHVGGSSFDPIQQKLIWTQNFGLGGQPTYHICKNIPPGIILGMDITRDGQTVFLLMYEDSSHCTLWVGNSTLAMSNDLTAWVKILKTGDTLSGAYTVDSDYLTYQPFGSMQGVFDTLYFGVRGIDGSSNRESYYCEYKNGLLSTTKALGYEYPSRTVTKNTYFSGHDLVHAKDSITDIDKYTFSDALVYDYTNSPVYNGVQRFPNTVYAYNLGGIWIDNLGHQFIISEPGELSKIVKDGIPIVTLSTSSAYLYLVLRGDYNISNQVQYVTGAGPVDGVGGIGKEYFGNLYKSSDGITFNFIEKWRQGTVECVSSISPNIMGWFPTVIEPSNEVIRMTLTGSAFTNATGNWWGTVPEVLAGTKMQVPDASWFLVNVRQSFQNYTGVL